MVRRRTFKTILLSFLTVAVLSGCSANAAEELPSGSGAIEEETLKVSVWSYDISPYYQAVIEEYQNKTGCRIEVIDMPANDYIDKLSSMLYSSQDLDVILAKDIPSFVEMIKRHQLEDLDSYVEKNHTDLSGYHGLTDQVRYDGKLYGMPYRNDYYLLFYNKDIFDNAGIPYPSGDMTWEEYRTLAEKLTDRENGIYGSHLHTWRTLAQNWTIQDGKHTVIEEDYSFMKPAYEMILQMQNVDKSIMDFSKLKAGNIHYRSLFHNGNIAMLPMGSWLITDTIIALEAGGTELKNWGVTRLPHPEGVEPGYTMGASTQAAINVRSEKKELAYDFLEFLCGEEGARILIQNGAIPAWSSSELKTVYASVPGFPQDCLDALDITNMVIESPVHRQMTIIDKILTEEHEAIMTGEKSIDQGLSDMGERVSKVLKES